MTPATLNTFLKQLTRGMAAETLGDQTDRQLVEQFLAGRSEAAFEAIVRRHGAMVYRVCWRVLQQTQDTEDAFQATFLLLAQKLRTIRKHDSLASWLHGVAHRVALQAKARAASRRRHEQRARVPEVARSDNLSAEELLAAFDAELGKLPDKWRLPLILCYLEGRTQEESASQLGWSKSTLRRRLEEARDALGRRLKGRGIAWSAALSAVLLSDCLASAAPARGLVTSTIEAAASVAAGKTAATVASAKVVALTEGVLRTMFLTKLKIATVALLIAGTLGGGWFASLALSGTPAEPKAAEAKRGAPEPAPKAEKQPKEILEKAGSLADDVKDNARKAFALMKIATAQIRAGDQTEARKTFQQAVRAAEAINHEDRKGTTLMLIAEAQAEAGEVEAALKTAEAIQTERSNSKEWALAQVASAQAKAKNVKGAMKTVEAIRDEDKAMALMLVASRMAEAGDSKQALKLAEDIQDEYYRVQALTNIADAQLLAGDRDGAKTVIDAARKIADGMEDSNPDVNTSRKTWAQMRVALAQIASGDEKAGLKRADDFKASTRRDTILAAVAISRAKVGKVKEASQAVEGIQDGVQKGAVLRAVAAAQARAGDFKAARKTTEAIESVREKVEALLDVAAVRLTTGNQTAAADLYREAIQALKTLDTLWYDGGPMCATPSLLRRIVSAWAEAGDAKSALAWADKQESAFVRAIALAGIAEGVGRRLDREKQPADKK